MPCANTEILTHLSELSESMTVKVMVVRFGGIIVSGGKDALCKY